MVLAFLLLTATVIPFIPIEQAYSLLPETETFTIPVHKDSFLKQGSQAHNEGANIILNIISSDKHRPVIAFDQNSISGAIDGRPLQSAILRLYITENGNNWGSSGNTIGAHRLLSDWHEGNGWNWDNNIAGIGSGVTWGCAIDSDISNNQNDCAAQWNGGAFQSTAIGTVLITNNLVNHWVELNVTSDVQAYIDGTASNYGWLIKKGDESQNGALQFASKEASANRPVLEITVIRPEAVLANEYLTIIAELDELGRSLNQTEITPELVNGIDSDLSRLQEIVIELQNLGFDGEASAARVDGKMVGAVKFYDPADTVLFETTIPDGTLGIFAAIGLRNQFQEDGVEMPFDILAISLAASYNMVQAIANFQDNGVATDFVMSGIAAFHPSTGETFTLVWSAGSKVGRAIATAIMRCFANNDCKLALDTFLPGPGDDKFLEWAFPSFRVTGSKFNDRNGNGLRESGDDGLSGWLFVVSTSTAPRIFEGFTSASGAFVIEGQYPRSTHTLVVKEQLKNGWEATTPGGESQEIFFNVTAIPFNPIPGSPVGIFEPAPRSFGNFELGEISGFKYNDANGNGNRDAGEAGMPGWSIALKNATSGSTINSTITDSSGLYIFTGLKFGSYIVEEVQQEGFTQKEPATGFYAIDIQSGTFSLGNDFGNQAIDPIDVIWYGADSGAVSRLRGFGFDVETRNRPVGNLDSTVVVIATGAFGVTGTTHFTSAEVSSLQSFVSGGGRLIFAVDTEYFHCNPDSNCGAEVSKNFGFGFDGDVQSGPITPAAGQSNHPIWRTPNALSSFTNWCCDAYVKTITDSNVLVLGRVSGTSFETGEPTISVSNVPAIVVNQNPAFNGGKVMGIGYNMFVGIGDFRMFDNIMTFMLGQTVGGAPGGPYHYVELNQTSANVTRPDSVTIEVEVEWYNPYWSAQPVEITLGNMTGTNITYSIQSIYNTTEYQIFELTLHVTEDVQPGAYVIPIIAKDLEDGYIEQVSFVLYVE